MWCLEFARGWLVCSACGLQVGALLSQKQGGAVRPGACPALTVRQGGGKELGRAAPGAGRRPPCLLRFPPNEAGLTSAANELQ